MNRTLDRAGIFKAKPIKWDIQASESTQSVAVFIELVILAQYVDGAWASWDDYEQHTTRGWWYIVGKTGAVNQVAVDQLVSSLGWNGNLAFFKADPPEVIVQINVAEDTYNGKTSYKPTWMNHENYSPAPQGVSADSLAKLNAQFGSLLRAAAASTKKK